MTDEQDPKDGNGADDPQGGAGPADDGATAGGDRNQPGTFRIRKVYLKDVSFESPAAPGIFASDGGAEARINLQLNTESRQVGENLYEVVLVVTVTSADDERTVYLVEVRQAGLFEVAGFPAPDQARVIGSYCPGILFPYARETVAGLVEKGGFPQLALQPINFDALFAQQLQKQQQDSAEPSGQPADGDGSRAGG